MSGGDRPPTAYGCRSEVGRRGGETRLILRMGIDIAVRAPHQASLADERGELLWSGHRFRTTAADPERLWELLPATHGAEQLSVTVYGMPEVQPPRSPPDFCPGRCISTGRVASFVCRGTLSGVPPRDEETAMAGTRDALWWAGSRTMTRGAAVAAATVVAAALLPTSWAEAVPGRGNRGWSVLLCKFSDVAGEPQMPTFFGRMFGAAGAGQEGLYDYYRDQSYGKVRVSATVRGWYSMPYSTAQEAPKSRWDKIADCVQTAADNGYPVPAGNRVAVITNAQQDSGSAGGRVLLDPGAWNIRFAAHEMGHGYGLDHSFSDDTTYQNASWSQPGEYDDMWDEMSAQHVYGFNTPSFGNGGVGFNAFARDKLGFIPRNRILTFGANDATAATVRLAALQRPSAPGPLLVRVPADPGDLFHYYTVEYQRNLDWSRGIPADTVLIHEVRNGRPTLLRQLSVAGKPPRQQLSANGVSIQVTGLSGDNATVSITSNIASRCLQGWVWREARPGDQVCVTGATRTQTAADNSVRASRWVNGPFGPHTCLQGYVWREAYPGDDVCVTGDVRAQAATDNAQANNEGSRARQVFGPNTCKPGYVWREADLSDYVCVTGATRAQVRADNSVRASRWVNGPFGPHTCLQGYVWREAYPGDDVCVTGDIRAQAAADNTQTAARVLRTTG